jgi:hypothetical protein
MFPEWNQYLQRIKADDHRRLLRHVERVAAQRRSPKAPR